MNSASSLSSPQPVPLHATPWRRVAPDAPLPSPPTPALALPVALAPVRLSPTPQATELARVAEALPPAWARPTPPATQTVPAVMDWLSGQTVNVFSPLALWADDPPSRKQTGWCLAQAAFWGWVGCAILPQDPAHASGASGFYLTLLVPASLVVSCLIMAMGRGIGTLFSTIWARVSDMH